MNIISKILPSIVAVALVASCSKMHDEPLVQQDREQEVELAIPVASTRTMIGDDGKTTNWVVGDKIALWAEKSDDAGNFVVENATFMLRHFSPTYDKAFFSAKIADLPPVDNYEMQRYNYYLCSPLPNSVNGTEVTFNLPAVQSGKYEGGYDIMVARPVEEELSLTYFGQTELNTSFMHQMHALKITVPNGNNLDGNKIRSITMTFPVPVAGDITFDVTNPDSMPIYTNTSNTITVESEAGFNIGDTIWVFVLPGSVTSTDNISYYMRGERRRSNEVSYQRDINMERGHVTPITMSVPEIYPYYTAVHFSIDQNNLGEDFNYFDIYSPSGTHMGRFQRNANNKYTVDYEGEFDANEYDNSSWRVVFDSEHAVVETTINLGDVTTYTEHTRWMNVPYLLYENFSQLNPTFEYNDERVTNLMEAPGHLLNDYLPVDGWNGAHIKGVAGQSVRVNVRHQNTSGVTRSNGRLDTPAMGRYGLKADAEVKLKVMFDMGAYVNSGYSSDNGVYLMAGTHIQSDESAIDGKVDTKAFGNVDSDDTRIPSLFQEVCLKTGDVPASYGDNSFADSFPTYSFTADRCTSASRFCWVPCCKQTSWFWSNNAHYYLYLDNIRVQIVK